MSLSTTWRDFVIYPKQPDRVRNRAERLDLKTAIPIELFGSGDEAARIDQSIIMRYGDEFEAMRIDDHGQVMIWTKKRVWCLRREFGMEKLIYLPRHPIDSEKE